MSHLAGILDRQKQLAADLLGRYSDTHKVGEASESWSENHPNYQSLMAKQDEAIDLINDFYADFQGKISDMESLV